MEPTDIPSNPPQPPSNLWLALAVAIGVGATALTVRVLGTGLLQTAQGVVRPTSSDAHYYLRRMVQAVQTFPHLSTTDPGLTCPQGAVPPWPGGLERGVAALLHLGPAAWQNPQVVEQFAAWLPVASGVLAAWLTAALAWLWLGRRAAVAAGLISALLPLHIWYTAYSFVDHHMLLGPLVCAALWSLDLALRRPRWQSSLAIALSLGLAFALVTEAWIAMLLLVSAALLAALWGPRELPERTPRLTTLAWGVAGAGLVAVPAICNSPYFIQGLVAPHAPSRFTLWLLAGLTTTVTTIAWLAGAQQKPRILALFAGIVAGLAVLGLALVVDPAMADAVAAAAGFSQRQGMVAAIEESRPLWSRPWPQPLVLMGGAVVLLPALPFAFQTLPQPRRVLLVAALLLLTPLGLGQVRFGLVLAVPYALAWAAILTGHMPRWPRIGIGLGALALLPLALGSTGADRWSAHEESLWRTMSWMKKHLPPPSDQGPRCVLAPWDVGHKILHVTGQPVVASNFTELRERQALRDSLQVLLAASAADAETVLAQRQVRWLWTMATPWAVWQAYASELGVPSMDLATATDALGTRLLRDAGSARAAGAGGNRQMLEGTGTLRRIHQSPLELTGLFSQQLPGAVREISLYERVAGAHIRGHATAGTVVWARIQVKHPGAPAFEFAQLAIATRDERYDLRVPYATSGMPFSLQALGPWQVRVGDAAAIRVDVAESAVESGHSVEVAAPAATTDTQR